MRVRFYGTRGSIATPGDLTVRYGGNTSCVAVRSQSGTLAVLDIGTGAAILGRDLMAAGRKLSGHILISHTHWDHIQGFPFFAPLFVPGNEWDIYAPRGLSTTLRDILAGQMEYTYFPVELDQLGATIRYHDLVEGTLQVGDIAVTTRYLNHPALTLGYRLEADGASIVYSCDHEPHNRELAAGGEIDGADRRHAEFLSSADLVIHDAQYVAAEYPTKVGWGHSTAEYALAVASAAHVKKLALTHHDPMRSDDDVDRIVERLCVTEGVARVEVFAASEGMEMEVSGQVAPRPEPSQHAQKQVGPALSNVVVVAGLRSLAVIERLEKALAGEDVRCIYGTPEKIPALIAQDSPSLLLLELDETGSAAHIADTVRACNGELPIIAVTPRRQQGMDGQAVADQLVEPFSPSYARARIRAALMRRACRWRPAEPPSDEVRRLEALRRMNVLDSPPEERFDRITRLAAAAFAVPIALLTLLDRDRQWFKSTCGLGLREGPRDESFCAHAVASRSALVVPDAFLDDRFAENPAVVGERRIRFYAGQPLILSNGVCIGTVCIADTRPREFEERDVALLSDLAQLAVREFEVE